VTSNILGDLGPLLVQQEMEEVENLKVEKRSSSNQEYELDGPGQFVLVSNTTYGYKFPDYKDGFLERLRMFERNKEMLINSLELNGNGSAIILHEPRPTRPEEFTRIKGDDTLSFYEMMEDLCDPEKPSPSFLIFVLQGHGDKDGNIYLGHKNGCNEGCQHQSTNQCARLNINGQVIEKIKESKRFLGKPKVFIIDCSGTLSGYCPNQPRAKCGNKEQTEYWPEGADTFIARSTLQDMEAIGLEEEGTYFIKSICEEFDRLKLDVLRSEIHQFFQSVLFQAAMEVSGVNAEGDVIPKQQPKIKHTLNKRLLLSKLIATMTPPPSG